MRVLVTGGAGFIGSHVAEALKNRGDDVVVLDDLSTGRRANIDDAGVTLDVGDIRDPATVERVMSGFRPDVVCHQAAQTSVSVSVREPIRDAQINVVGSLVLLDAALRHKVKRIVFASTGGAIYGEVDGEKRANPTWPARPLSPYACSKLSFEAYLTAARHEHGLASTVLRYANVYGPRQDPHGEAGVVAIFTQRAMKNEMLFVNARKTEGDDGCVRDYVYVGDVVRANLAAIDGSISESVVNVCSGEATTTRTLAEQIAKRAGVSLSLGFRGRRAGDLERSVLEPAPDASWNSDRTPLDRGLSATVDWFRSKTTR